MHEHQKWLKWINSLPNWVKGAIGLATAIIGFVILFRENYHIGTVTVGLLLLVSLLCLCVYLVLAKTPPLIEGGKGVYRYARYRLWAIAGIILALVVGGLALALRPSRSFIITAFAGTATPAPTPTLAPTSTSIQTPVSTPTPTVDMTPGLGSLHDLAVLAREVAADVGEVTQVVEGSDRRIIVIFEETHHSPRGQVEIAVMLNRLYEDHSLRHIAQEGSFTADGTLDATWFNPSLAAGQVLSPKEQVVVQLLAQGEISSGEMMALIYPDVQVHGIEKAAEYNVTLSDSAIAAPTVYLYLIAIPGMSDTEISKANDLIEQEKVFEAIDFTISTNPFTDEMYKRINDETTVLSAGEWIEILDEIEAKASEVSAEVDADDRADMKALREFFAINNARTRTMELNLLEIAAKYPDAPMATIVGAAHTELFSQILTESGVSFAVIRPKSLTGGSVASDLSSEASERKLLGLSVDTADGLGALLDGRKKPHPVLDRVWFRSKAETYFLTALVACIDPGLHPLLSTPISNELAQMQYVVLLPDSFQAVQSEKIFAVRAQVEDLSRPTEVWIRTTTARATSVRTLESALVSTLSSLDGFGAPKPSVGTSPVHVTPDVLAVFSADYSVVESTSLSQ
jgi:hypothetical protein